MSKQTKKRVILAGLGSIGKFYLRSLKKNNFHYIVFDPKVKKKKFFFNSYKDLANEIKNNKYTHVIICSQADTHFFNFNFFFKYGLKNFLIEKPMGNNLSDLYKIKKKALDYNIRILSNYKWSVVDLHKQIKSLQKKFKMGKLYNFISYAGACCIATGGIHTFDFLNNFFSFKKNNFEILAKLKLDKINPRNKNLYNIGGFVNFTKDRVSATIHYDNSSRIAPYNIMLFKNYKIEFNLYGEYKIFSVNQEFWKEKITRYSYPLLVKKGKFYKINLIDKLIGTFIKSNVMTKDINKGINCFEVILASMISSKTNSPLSFNNISQSIRKYKFFNKNILIT
jgi:predicted dehydrogenase